MSRGVSRAVEVCKESSTRAYFFFTIDYFSGQPAREKKISMKLKCYLKA